MVKYSKQREAILNYLLGTKSHPTADQIYQDLKESMQNLSLATVYRNLNFLLEQGKIIKLDTGEAVDRFDADTSNHYHFICQSCHKVTDIFDEILSNHQLETILGEDFKVNYHKLYVYGTCNLCNNN